METEQVRKKRRWDRRAIRVGLISGNLCGIVTAAYLAVMQNWFHQVMQFRASQTALTEERYLMDTLLFLVSFLPMGACAWTITVARRHWVWWGLLPLVILKLWQTGLAIEHFGPHGIGELWSGISNKIVAWFSGYSIAYGVRKSLLKRGKTQARLRRRSSSRLTDTTIWPPPPRA